MPAPTTLWNSATPTSTDLVSEGEQRIRELKAGIQERLRNAGIYWPDPDNPASADAGRQAIGQEATNKWRVYETNRTDVAIDMDDSAALRTVTFGTGKGGARDYKLIAEQIDAALILSAGRSESRVQATAVAIPAAVVTTAAEITTFVQSDAKRTVLCGISFNLLAATATAVNAITGIDIEVNRTGAGYVTLRSFVGTTAILLNGNATSPNTFPFGVVFCDTGATANGASPDYRIRITNTDATDDAVCQQLDFWLAELV